MANLRQVEAIVNLKKMVDELKNEVEGLKINTVRFENEELLIYLNNGQIINCGYVKGKTARAFATSISRCYMENKHLHIVLTDGTDTDVGYVGGGEGGAVDSVNGKTGEVVLDYEDVGASPSDHTHDYEDLNNLPTLFSGDYNDLSNKPELFSGDYEDLTNKPTLFSGDYNDLTNKPTIPTVPTNLSEFTDDLGSSPTHTHSQYLTEHQDISSLATKEEVSNEANARAQADTNLQTAINGKAELQHTHDGRYYTKSEVNNLTTFVVHLQDGEGGTLYADYTFVQILAAINRMQWVILKYQDQTYTVYERDNSHILWQSTRYYSSTLATKLFNLTSADVWSKESQTLSLNDIKPIVVHITKEGSVVTADYTFNQLIGAVSDQVIECCYNGNHVPMGTHTSQKITFTAQDVDMDTGATTEIVIEVDNTNTWRMIEDTYVPLKQDKLLYDYSGGLHVDGTLNSTYVDENGMLITTGSSGEWDAWNITDMDLSEFKIIRFVCYRDSSNTGGTWVCDVPLLTPIQISGGVGFFVSSGAMNSFGDRNRWNVLQAGVRWNNGDIDAISIGQVFSLYGTAATTVSGIKCCAVYGVY